MNAKIKFKYYAYIIILIVGIAINFHQFFVEQWLRFKLRNETIVVAFTTTPYRINQLKPILETLAAQNASIYKIYISIPYKFKRDNLEYVIPEWLQDYKNVSILRTEDYGPGTKLLGVLEKADLPPDAIIITVDDDIFYPKNMILHLAYKAKMYPNDAIGNSGVKVNYDKNGKLITNTGIGLIKHYYPNASVDVLEGWAGVAYRPKFFDETIFAINDSIRECINSDDLYLSFYLAKHNVTRRVLRNRYMSAYKMPWNKAVGFNSDALHNLKPSRLDKHVACISYMKAADPAVVF